MKNKLLSALVMVALLAAESHATILATATNGNPFSVKDGFVHNIPLFADGTNFLTFRTTRVSQKVIIQYNAECSVAGQDDSTWLDIDIVVDGVAAPPSNGDNAFCTSLAGHAGSRWVSAITSAVMVVPSPGSHLLQVRGSFGFGHHNAGDFWWVDDSSTEVFN
jgi:hypothetical protein